MRNTKVLAGILLALTLLLAPSLARADGGGWQQSSYTITSGRLIVDGLSINYPTGVAITLLSEYALMSTSAAHVAAGSVGANGNAFVTAAYVRNFTWTGPTPTSDLTINLTADVNVSGLTGGTAWAASSLGNLSLDMLGGMVFGHQAQTLVFPGGNSTFHSVTMSVSADGQGHTGAASGDAAASL